MEDFWSSLISGISEQLPHLQTSLPSAPLSGQETWELLLFFMPKLVVAMICGGIVGIERELRGRPAGLKTNILICAGATMFTASSFLFSGLSQEKIHTMCRIAVDVTECYARHAPFAISDPMRIVAQLVAGVGFLGAGAIFRSQDRIKGLTSAAFIFVNTSLGVIIGSGGLVLAICLTLGLLFLTLFIEKLEERIKMSANKALGILHLQSPNKKKPAQESQQESQEDERD
jgi:putative Mg2+ transporter-C (MgtC) family protein